jgi:hypothetical protein
MSFVYTRPEAPTAAAGSLQGISSSMSAQTRLRPPQRRELFSWLLTRCQPPTAAQFAPHAQMYQAVSAQSAAIHEMFVNSLGTSAGSHAATEAANAVAAG